MYREICPWVLPRVKVWKEIKEKGLDLFAPERGGIEGLLVLFRDETYRVYKKCSFFYAGL